MRGISAEDASAKGVTRAVGQGDGLRDGPGGLHNEAYRSEEFGLSDAHRRMDVDYQSGAEVMAGRVSWVVEVGAAGDETGTLGDGFADEGFEIVEVGGGDAGTDIDWLSFGCWFCCLVQVVADAQGLDAVG